MADGAVRLADAKDNLETFKSLRRKFDRSSPKARRWVENEYWPSWKFYNGQQLSEEDEQQLKKNNRPIVTFNHAAVMVNAVVGSEISNRREVQFYPREQGDAKGNELLGAAGEWVRDNCNAEDEETSAFLSSIVCGMGWTETYLDYDDNLDGDAIISDVDAAEIVWDTDARKPNLSDASYVFRAKRMTLEAAQHMFPDKEPSELNAAWADPTSPDDVHAQRQAQDAYKAGEDPDPDNDVVIVEAQWFEYEPVVRIEVPDMDSVEPVMDPATGQPAIDPMTGQPVMGQPTKTKIEQVEPKKFKELQRVNPGIRGVKQQKRKVMRAFMGNADLLENPVPGLCPTHFSYQAVTGYYDKHKGYFYGIIRATKDPSKLTNKLFSQILHILNTTAKGGVMIEKGAVQDIKQFERSWAKADAVTEVAQGALSASRVQPKPSQQLPTGFFSLMEFTSGAIRDVTGINLETMGLREATQSGVLEYQRREAGQAMLAILFNAFRRYRKTQGRVLLYIIQEFLSDGRLIRIVGDEKKEYVPLVRSDKTNLEYDIIVDDAPTSPNEKEKTWSILVQMMPFLKDNIDAEMGLELLTYSPLPTSFVEKLKAAAAKKSEEASQNQELQMQKQLEQANAQATVAKTQAESHLKEAQAAKTEVEIAQMKQAETLASLMGIVAPAVETQTQQMLPAHEPLTKPK